MVNNLFPQFLEDTGQYEASERYWQDLWDQVEPSHRNRFRWAFPWIGTGSPGIKDGNPIFSAYSPVLGRGIRVIQEEPAGSGLDIRVWLDTFGGDITDPDRIHELVISCTLSDATAYIARTLMTSWVRGQSLSFKNDEAGRLVPDEPARSVPTIETQRFAA